MDKAGRNLTTIAEIEAGLDRLMPRGLGEEARGDLEATVDHLAQGTSTRGFWGGLHSPNAVGQTIAAALVLAALGTGMWVLQKGAHSSREFASLATPELGSGIEVLAQMTWIESGADLGVQSLGQDGDVSQGWSYTGVEEERILHEDSGYEVILQRDFEAELYAASSL